MPPPPDPSARAWLLPSDRALGMLWAPRPRAVELSWRPGPGHLEGQSSCLREDVARRGKSGEKIRGLVVGPRELQAQETSWRSGLCSTPEKLKDAKTHV